jgi:starch synthase (maltosyl-transferring)
VRIFRVDNPHTKPFAFWEWLLLSLKREYPELIFLAEAFTRPKVMYELAKLGFTQSYTYFTWRRTKSELVEYLTELTTTEVHEFFRPNFWPNTPDILMDYLQQGGTPAFKARLVLAATLGGNYGVYGPAFELCVNTPREKGSEEYLNSEKYEIKHWDLESPDSIRDVVSRVNTIRATHPALQRTNNLTFHEIDNDQLIAYSKVDENTKDLVLTLVNMDAWHTQSGWVHTDFGAHGIGKETPFQVRDLLSGKTYTWHGEHNYVELKPNEMPAHIFEVIAPASEFVPANDAS